MTGKSFKEKRAAVKSVLRAVGARLEVDLTSEFPRLAGAGPVDTRLQYDGRTTRLLLPAMHSGPRTRTCFPNLAWPGKQLQRSNGLGLLSWQEAALTAAMPPVARENLVGPEYIVKDGLRTVPPYFDCLRSCITDREFPGPGSTITACLTERFPSYPASYFHLLLRNSQIAVNLERVEPDYVLQEGDILTHCNHRHENPVLDRLVDNVYEDEEMLVVDKPPSWPIYPIGNYRLNSLVYILMREYGYRDLRTVHRLDAGTSGVCILGKGPGVSGRLQKYFTRGLASKQYLALVDGRFPAGETHCSKPLGSYKISPQKLRKGREERAAHTEFRLERYCERSNTSLVVCRPTTGRTHQIRLHLEELGFYIVRDSLYNPADYEAERTELDREQVERAVAAMLDTPPPPLQPGEQFTHHYCLKCQAPAAFAKQEPSFMCLHSFRYSLGQDWTFQSRLPDWAERPWEARPLEKDLKAGHS